MDYTPLIVVNRSQPEQVDKSDRSAEDRFYRDVTAPLQPLFALAWLGKRALAVAEVFAARLQRLARAAKRWDAIQQR